WLKIDTFSPFFFDVVQKVNRVGKRQPRLLILTRTTVASSRLNGKTTRAFGLADIRQVWVQGKEVVFKVPDQYDLYVVTKASPDQLLGVLSALIMEATGALPDIRNVMPPYSIGKGDYVFTNRKPREWKPGQHLIHTDRERALSSIAASSPRAEPDDWSGNALESPSTSFSTALPSFFCDRSLPGSPRNSGSPHGSPPLNSCQI
ncbi:hypothetical protein DIPPA_29813, partial [Diplonema papillatum]